MSKLILDRGNFADFTSVSNLFIDEYMPKASGEFVKIYLHLLRLVSSNASELSVSRIADVLNFTENDVFRGLNYWEELGLLSMTRDERGNICGVRLEPLNSNRFYVKNILNNMDSQVTAKAVGDTIVSSATDSHKTELFSAAKAIPVKRKYTSREISAFAKDARVSQLTFLAQTYLGKTLNSTDINSILYMLDGLALSSDFIEYIMEMCISSGNKSLSSIEKTAVNYYKKGIVTIDDAKLDAKLRKSIYKSVFKIFELTDKPSAKKDISYITKWSDEYGFSEDIIVEACHRTMEHTHSASFPYADSILTRWHHCGISSFDQIEKLDKEHSDENAKKYARTKGASIKSVKNTSTAGLKKFKNMTERSYDMEEVEKMLLGVKNK